MNIGFLSLKGGVGKTILSVHFAFYLHELDRKVVLLDGEPGETALDWHQRGELFPFPVGRLVDWDARYDAEPDTTYVIDTVAHPNDEELIWLIETLDLAICPVTVDVDSQRKAEQLAPEFTERGKNFRTVVNAAPPPTGGSGHGEEVLAYLKRVDLNPFETIIRQRIAYLYAKSEGVPVYASSQRASMSAWLEFRRLGEEVVESYEVQ